MRVYVCMYVHIYVCMYMYLYACICVDICIYRYVCMYEYVYKCVYLCINHAPSPQLSLTSQKL